jgi:hypothetical protein
MTATKTKQTNFIKQSMMILPFNYNEKEQREGKFQNIKAS